MGRISVVASHDRLPEIKKDLLSGVPQSTIALKYGVSTASVSRYVNSHRSDLARESYEETSIIDLMGRMKEIADDAQDLRRQARLGGNPNGRAKAIQVEMKVISELLNNFGVDDTTFIELGSSMRELIKALREFFDTYPASARDLLYVMEKYELLGELTEAFTNKKEQTNE